MNAFAFLAGLQAARVPLFDLLLTDPPYSTEVDDIAPLQRAGCRWRWRGSSFA